MTIIFIHRRDAAAYHDQGWQVFPLAGWHGAMGRWYAVREDQ